MREFYLEATFWLGATAVTIGLLILVLWLLGKLWDEIAKHKNILWNVFEYAYYKKKFEKWIAEEGLERNPKSIKFHKSKKKNRIENESVFDDK